MPQPGAKDRFVAIEMGATETQDAALLVHGAYAPLTTFMNQSQYQSVLHSMRLPEGALFPMPIVLPVASEIAQRLIPGQVVALRGSNGWTGELRVTQTFERDLQREAQLVYGTTSCQHPGVATLLQSPAWCAAGSVTLCREGESMFPEAQWPHQVRAAITEMGWETVTFFQTRNPPHRAHEYMLKLALEATDGLVIHPLVGPTKRDDVPATIRMAAYRTLIREYFPGDRVLLATFGGAMRYAGPREALFHGLVRKNYGATHVIVGRDAAGVGTFYSPMRATQLFRSLAGDIGVTPLCFDQIGYCCKCQSLASDRTCPHRSDWLAMSGTMVRDLLRHRESPPIEVMRPEIATILMTYYRSQEG
ncbi:MAG: sulfate adenylyltransferase [Sulfobacillus acidophilus]|uniref:sulfate adenylyltransferase n=1 Tax=Sulfobacillus acidophilus TaxID=53633 RepID=A0A2T2WK20_9FIRM|nr:MAG: sulfate adenylyltransferase [Sulfobacillus acidophilus]